MKKQVLSITVCIALAFTIACKKMISPAPATDSIMSAAIEGLTLEQNKKFSEGAEEFGEIYNEQTGLGPIYVATSCAGCHSGDNKGHPSTNLTRFGQSDTFGNKYLHLGAPQLQHFALPGFQPETLPTGATSSKFIAPIVAGLGLIESIPDQEIIALADPFDKDGDGISGRVHWNHIPAWVSPLPNAIQQNDRVLCRFGRKAAVHNLHQQVVGAFNNDMGITTSFMPIDPMNPSSGIHPAAASGADIDDKSLVATVFYIQTLQAPIQRKQNDAEVMAGQYIFTKIGCAKCHTETMHTGNVTVSALSNKTIHPYSDFLLHDMGDALNDHYTEGFALSSEWRTTPLWGIGLAKDAQGGLMYLMHDGRAHSFEEAIQLHGGEGAISKNNYQRLNATEQKQLLQFLFSL